MDVKFTIFTCFIRSLLLVTAEKEDESRGSEGRCEPVLLLLHNTASYPGGHQLWNPQRHMT